MLMATMIVVVVTSPFFQIHPFGLLHKLNMFLLLLQKRIQVAYLEWQVSHGKIDRTIMQSLQLLGIQVTHGRIGSWGNHHVHIHEIPRNTLHEITLRQNAHADRFLPILVLSTSPQQDYRNQKYSYFHSAGYIKFFSSITSSTSVRYFAASYFAIGKLCNK